MPELPEVEVVRRGLRAQLLGARVAAVEVRERRLRRPVATGALRRLVGRRVVEVGRRGKYLLVCFDRDRAMIVHLGMSGSLLLVRPADAVDRHDHVRWRLRPGGGAPELELRLRDPRRFGMVAVTSAARLRRHPCLATLGPEPFDAALTPGYLRRRSQGSRRPVKNLLMDATVVAGVGNIYASEALWVARVHPRVAAGRVSEARWRRIRDALRRVLAAAIAEGGTTLSDFLDVAGRVGAFQVRLRVYGRDGAPCPACGRPIRRVVLAGRSTYYCGRCQR